MREAYEHRIEAAWQCYGKWKHILENKQASLRTRLQFWRKTVETSLLWGLQTTRHTSLFVQRLHTTQKYMVRKMMHVKRRPLSPGRLEPWVDWQVRSLREAATAIANNDMIIGQTLHNLRNSWAGHIARFGFEGRDRHYLKYLILWRCRGWWEWQKLFNHLPGNEHFKHQADLGRLRRWEWQLPRKWLHFDPNA